MIIDLNIPVYSYDKLVSDAKSLAQQYHTVLQFVTIGRSHDNRDIILLKLGVGKQYMICCSGVHGRENINPVVLLRIVEDYADMYVNYKQQKFSLKSRLKNPTQNLKREYEKLQLGKCIYELLQTYTILIIPVLNPDGYEIALSGFESIRNDDLREKCKAMNVQSSEWKMNARGIDINRNFPSKLWAAKFEGDHPASENETKALIFIFHEYKSKGFIDFHSRGKQIYYYRSLMPDNYNKKQYQLAIRLKKITGYELVAPEEEIGPDDSGGNTVHYYSEHFNRPAITLETVEDEAQLPLDMKYRFTTYEEIRLVLLKFGSMII